MITLDCHCENLAGAYICTCHEWPEYMLDPILVRVGRGGSLINSLIVLYMVILLTSLQLSRLGNVINLVM